MGNTPYVGRYRNSPENRKILKDFCGKFRKMLGKEHTLYYNLSKECDMINNNTGDKMFDFLVENIDMLVSFAILKIENYKSYSKELENFKKFILKISRRKI